MARKPAPPPDDPEQYRRFIDMAREVEAEGTEEDFVKAFRRVAAQRQKRLKSDQSKD